MSLGESEMIVSALRVRWTLFWQPGCDESEKAVDFCNSGVMCLDGLLIASLLGAIRNDNVKSEFYLTDAVAIARAAGHTAIAVEGEEAEFQGINSRAELAVAERTPPFGALSDPRDPHRGCAVAGAAGRDRSRSRQRRGRRHGRTRLDS